jgi:hypothetical protein
LEKIVACGLDSRVFGAGHGVGADPAGFFVKQRGERFFYRLFDAGDIGDESGRGKMRESGLNEGGECGGGGGQKNEIGAGEKREIGANFGFGKS